MGALIEVVVRCGSWVVSGPWSVGRGVVGVAGHRSSGEVALRGIPELAAAERQLRSRLARVGVETSLAPSGGARSDADVRGPNAHRRRRDTSVAAPLGNFGSTNDARLVGFSHGSENLRWRPTPGDRCVGGRGCPVRGRPGEPCLGAPAPGTSPGRPAGARGRMTHSVR
jgi:hypothetical protein